MAADDKTLEELFQLADKVGKKRYHKLTPQDFEDYRKLDFWRYVNGDYECGTTQESQQWARDNSERHCPICGTRFADCGGRTIDHKLPRAQYPWLALDFRNLWVICRPCNQEKGEMHWYEYEHYIFIHRSKRYEKVQFARPRILLQASRSKS